MKSWVLRVPAVLFITGCSGLPEGSSRVQALPKAEDIIFSTVAERPLSVSLRVDDLQFPHSDGILSAIDEINKDLPEEQRIVVNAAISSSRSQIEVFEVRQREFDRIRAEGGDFRDARRALLDAAAQVKPFLELGLTIRDAEAVLPPLLFTKVNKLISDNIIDIWARDNGLYGYTPSGEAVFVKTGRQGNGPSDNDLSAFYQAQIIAASDRDITENYGGNILALPNGLLLVGSNSTADLKKAFSDNKNYRGKVLFLEDQVLEVRHIDEQISVVPTSDACGFGIVKADPVRGKQMAAAIETSGEAFQGPPALQETAFFNWRYDVGGATFLDDAIVQVVANAINANVDRIREESAKINPACRSMKVASLAVPIDRCLTNDAGGPVGCVASAANSVNALILGNTAITSDPFYPSLRRDVEAAFAEVGAKVKFVNAAAMKAFGGGVHCGTNVRREPKRQ